MFSFVTALNWYLLRADITINIIVFSYHFLLISSLLRFMPCLLLLLLFLMLLLLMLLLLLLLLLLVVVVFRKDVIIWGRERMVVRACLWMCARAHVCARAPVWVYLCARVCVNVSVCVHVCIYMSVWHFAGVGIQLSKCSWPYPAGGFQPPVSMYHFAVATRIQLGLTPKSITSSMQLATHTHTHTHTYIYIYIYIYIYMLIELNKYFSRVAGYRVDLFDLKCQQFIIIRTCHTNLRYLTIHLFQQQTYKVHSA